MRIPALSVLAFAALGVNAFPNQLGISSEVSAALKSASITLTAAAPSTNLTAPAVASSTFSTVFTNATSVPSPKEFAAVADPGYWLKDIAHQGRAAFNSNPTGYKVFRNVKDYGAKGDGSTDDTAAINAAIQDGNRCAPGTCQSTTTSPAVVYFPAGTYVVSTSIVPYYMTQLIGNPNSLPVLKATAGFTGLGVIEGDPYQSGGAQGWGSTNVFYRQVRNLVIDLTAIPPATAATGIHWPTSQATSLQNVQILMTQSSSSQQQGIFIENGSGGFMSDLIISGGEYGMNIGNQQFTMRNVQISNAIVGISQIWNWGWLYQGFTITNCGTAFDMSNGGSSSQQVGSVVFIDSTITNCPVFVKSAWASNGSPAAAGSLVIENVALSNVPVAVQGPSGTVLAGGSTTISGWSQGHQYTPNGPTTSQGSYSPPSRPGALISGNKYITQSKPQYESLGTGSFVSVRSSGATGDGSTDDTTAIQNAVNSATSAGKVVFFDHGVYKVTNTIYFPPGARVVGETYSVIMASGATWSNSANPVPVVQVGKSGDSGHFEWSDMVVSTQGSAPGAVLIEWNMKADSGSGAWDVHTRIGGFAGSQLQVAQCPTGAGVSSKCMAAYMSIHITSAASFVYLENTWFWTADHDLDDASSTRVSIYTGRGMLLEGKTVFLYGTGVEHHALYQYQIANTNSVVAGFIQTETPYWQPSPDVKGQPYPLSTSLNDPTYSNCQAGNCDALGLRVLNSQNVFIYGAGLYSFFNNYDTTCSNNPSSGGTGNCQSEILSIEGSSTSNFWLYALTTIGSINQIVRDGSVLAKYSDNLDVFGQTIARFNV